MRATYANAAVTMKSKILFITVSLVVPWLALSAQHGTAPDGLDTWTGQITALNPDKQEVMLTAKKASETFILPTGAQFPDLSVGQYVRVDYLRMKHQVDGKWVKINTIIKIENVSQRKGS
jgi:hypothetical protein